MPVTLTRSQVACYTDRFSIYRRLTGTVNPTTGEVPDGVWQLKYSNVIGAFMPTTNDNDPSGVGRIKRDTMLTEDAAEFPAGTDLRAGDMLRITTPGDPGFGALYRVKAAPKALAALANCLEVQLMQDEQAGSLMPDANSFS